MKITQRYPRLVMLDNGAQAWITPDDSKNRHLVVETDRSESEVRRAFAREGFRNTLMEFVKDGQIGDGMVRKDGIWQCHVRFHKHGNLIQIDGEIEVSNRYFEHLDHGWIPALEVCRRIIESNFGRCWIYHMQLKRYVARIIQQTALRLSEPKTKTGVVATAATIVFGALAAYGAYRALR